MSPILKSTIQAAFPAIVTFGGISIAGKVARENLVPFAAVYSMGIFAQNVLVPTVNHFYPAKSNENNTKPRNIIMLVSGILITTIQYLAMRKCGILDNKLTIAFVAGAVVHRSYGLTTLLISK